VWWGEAGGLAKTEATWQKEEEKRSPLGERGFHVPTVKKKNDKELGGILKERFGKRD